MPLSVGTKRFFTQEKGLNFYWKNKWEGFDFTEDARLRRMNGIRTAECTVDIIKHYKPKFWAIENGARSFIFSYFQDVLKFSGFKNRCNYYSYGLKVLKPTVIYSNVLLYLKEERPRIQLLKIHQCGYKHKKEMREMYGNISQVPLGLYRDIAKQFELGGQPVLF